MVVAALASATQRFASNVSRWTQPRWAASSRSGRSKADVAFELLQRVADLAAEAEGLEHRAVPRLDNDLAMGDQLRVLVADLLAAQPPAETLTGAIAMIDEAHREINT